MHLTIRTSIAKLTIALATILAASFAVASANTGAEDTPEIRTITFQPGDNFVGWIDEPIQIGDLFERIPQIEVVYFWDAEGKTWRIAAPAMPPSLWTLPSIEPGMAVLVRNGSARPVPWIPQTAPVRGLVQLHTGTNWVSWAGPDGSSIDHVAKGIGRALQSVEGDDHAYRMGEPTSASKWPPLERGQPLVVTVRQSVNWLQPTWILPTIEFPGGASDSVRDRVHDDLLAVLDFYATTYGVHADPTDLDILIPKDFDSLVAHYDANDWHYDAVSLEDFWERAAGWAGHQLVVKQSLWTGPHTGRYTLSHEYFHHLQFQSSQRASTPTWLVEGTASWTDLTHAIYDNPAHHPDWVQSTESYVTSGPSLRTTVAGNGTWQYPLGTLAVERLVQSSDTYAPLEIYRGLVPQHTGPRQRWSSIPDWTAAFADVTGIGVSDFYTDFDDYHNSLPGRTTLARQADQVSFKGIVVRSSGTPVTGVTVLATTWEQNSRVGWPSTAITDPHGRFELFVPTDTTIRVAVILAEGFTYGNCAAHFSDGDARVDAVSESIDVTNLSAASYQIVVPDDHCRYWIRGRVTGPEGRPLSGFPVRATMLDTPSLAPSTSKLTGADGRFELLAPANGAYRLAIQLADGCSVFYISEGVTDTYDSAAKLTIDSASVSGVDVRIAETACSRTISGTIEIADGLKWTDREVIAQRQRGEIARTHVDTDRETSFSITVPALGAYRIHTWLDGCIVYYTPTGVTTDKEQAVELLVMNHDVTGLTFRLTHNPCSWTIHGRLVDASGHGVSGKRVYAQSRGENPSFDFTDTDGSFSIDVPSPGLYFLYIPWERRCWAQYRREGAVEERTGRHPSEEDEAAFVEVGEVGVTGIVFKVPEGLCS